MKFRTTLILALVLILGILGVVYLDKQDKSKEESDKQSEKILAYSGDDIRAIGIWPAGLMAVRDSAHWQLTQPIQTVGDDNNWNAIASMFEWAKMERIVSTEPAEYNSFGLLPPRAVLVLEGTRASDTLYVGDASPIGSLVYARKAGSPQVFLTTSSLWANVNKSLFELRDKSVLHFDQSKVTSLEIDNNKGNFYLSKEGGEWQLLRPQSYRADSPKIAELLNSLQYQKTTQFVAEQAHDVRSFGLDRPWAQVKLGLNSGLNSQVFSIGKASDVSFYARDGSRPMVFLVDSSFVNDLQVGLADLRDKKLLHINTSAVNGLTLTVSDTTFVCQKDTAGNWIMVEPFSRPVRGWKMTGILSDLDGSAAEGFVTESPGPLKPYGLDKPAIHCKLLQDGLVLDEFLLGKEKDLANRYAKTGRSEEIYLVKGTLFHKLNVRSSDLVETISPVAGLPQK